jgi:hypothetical protein
MPPKKQAIPVAANLPHTNLVNLADAVVDERVTAPAPIPSVPILAQMAVVAAVVEPPVVTPTQSVPIPIQTTVVEGVLISISDPLVSNPISKLPDAIPEEGGSRISPIKSRKRPVSGSSSGFSPVPNGAYSTKSYTRHINICVRPR